MISILQIYFGVDIARVFYFSLSSNVKVGSGFLRYPSFFYDAQIAGLFFSVVSVLCVGFISTITKNKNLAICLLGLGLFSLVLTGTRIALIGFFVSIFIFNLNNKQKLMSVFLFCVGTVLFILCVNNFTWLNLDPQRFSMPGIISSIETRISFWGNALIILLNNPLGVGFGDGNLYAAAVEQNLTGNGIYGFSSGNYAQFESSFFDIACALGYIGAVGMIWILGSFYYLGVFLYKKRRECPILTYSKNLMGAMTCFLICCLTAPMNRHDQGKFLFVFILGAMFSLYRIHLDDTKNSSSSSEMCYENITNQ